MGKKRKIGYRSPGQFKCPVCGKFQAVHGNGRFFRHFNPWPEVCDGSGVITDEGDRMPQYTLRLKVVVECGFEDTAKRVVEEALAKAGLKPEFMKTTKTEFTGRIKNTWD